MAIINCASVGFNKQESIMIEAFAEIIV